MRFFRDSASVQDLSVPTVLTMGNFDGVHLGHQMIIHEVVARARAKAWVPALMTFDPPPSRVLGRAALPQIMTLRDKCTVVGGLGIELFVCQTFNLALASMSPETFMQDILEQHLHPRQILVGYDFAFGKQRSGNVETLRRFFEPRGCHVEQFEPLRLPIDGEDAPTIVSSTQIRELLLAGDVTRASRLLGRPHFVSGTVVHGDARGQGLGFPTANVDGENMLPANGVYAVFAWVDGRPLPGVANVGRRPTFRGSVVRLEVHLLDFEDNLYEKRLRVDFVERLRGERRFAGVEALRSQIRRDIQAGRRILASRRPWKDAGRPERPEVGACCP